MKKFREFVSKKGKMVLIPLMILGVLSSVYIFNQAQNRGSAMVFAEGKSYLEASGTVENNSVNLTSEVSGNVAESLVAEGDEVVEGSVLARIGNTTLTNQQKQAEINVRLAEKKIETLETNLNNLKKQNEDAVSQAENAYKSVSAEYDKLKDGVSDNEIRQAQEAVNQARINRDYLKGTLADSRDLLDEGKLSQARYDEVKKNYEVASAQYNAASAQLRQLQAGPSRESLNAANYKKLQAKSGVDLAKSNSTLAQAQLEGELEIAKIQLEQNRAALTQTQTELDKLSIKSPVSGTVNTLLVKQGEYAQIGKVFAQISPNHDLSIRAYVSEANIGKVKVGQTVEVYTDADSSKAFPGRITRIANQAEFTPKNIQTKEERVNTVFEVKILVQDAEGSIKAGMPVDLRILMD